MPVAPGQVEGREEEEISRNARRATFQEAMRRARAQAARESLARFKKLASEVVAMQRGRKQLKGIG